MNTAEAESAAQSNTTGSILIIGGAILVSVVLLVGSPGRGDARDSISGTSEAQAATLTKQQLVAIRPSPAACRELLRRDEATPEELRDAVMFLARHQRQPKLQVLLSLMKQLPSDCSDAEIANFIRLLATTRTRSRDWKEQVRPLVNHASRATRTIAMATSVLLDDELGPTWSAIDTPHRIPELIRALALVESAPLQETLYEDVYALATSPDSDEAVRHAAIAVMPEMSGCKTDQAGDIIDLLRQRRDIPAAMAAIAKIPPEDWPTDQLGFLAAALIAYAADTPNHQSDTVTMRTVKYLANELAKKLEPADRNRFQARLSELTAAEQ